MTPSSFLFLPAMTDAVPGEQLVGVEGAKALELLVSASPDKKKVCPLIELAAQQSEAAATGFSKVRVLVCTTTTTSPYLVLLKWPPGVHLGKFPRGGISTSEDILGGGMHIVNCMG